MYVADKLTIVARTVAEIPEKALPSIRPEFAARLGGSVGEVFPDFARSFPATAKSMGKHWAKPAVAFTDMGRNWLAQMFLEQPMLNLFIKQASPPAYVEGPIFDEARQMLPEQWLALYRFMESFTITNESFYSPLGWKNTPLPRGLSVDEFSAETHTKKAKLKAFAKQLDVNQPQHLRCWMFTDAHDSLWIDEEHCDKKVYHVHADAFADAYVLPDPGATLDRYLAHVVAGGLPKDFDFRGAD